MAPGSPCQRGVFSTPGPTPSCSPGLPGAKGTRKRQRTAAAARGQHSQRSGKRQAKGHRPRLHRPSAPAPGLSWVPRPLPLRPRGRKVDGPLPPGPQTEEPVVGSGAQAVPARLVSREAPTSRGSLGAQRGPPQEGKPGKSGNKTSNMKSWGRRGTPAATSSGRVTGAPATEQAWPCWGGRGGQGGGPGGDDEKGRSRDAPLETDTS